MRSQFKDTPSSIATLISVSDGGIRDLSGFRGDGNNDTSEAIGEDRICITYEKPCYHVFKYFYIVIKPL